MEWMRNCMFGLMWSLMTMSSGWAQVTQAEVQHAGASMKPYGDSYDSDTALKISQAAISRSLGGYTFHDRQGRLARLEDYRGKPLLLSLVYTSCFHICPTTTQNLARATDTVSSAVGRDSFNVVTIGFDAAHDTPERMRAYARQQGVSGEKNWVFLSADKATITRLTTELGFLFTPSPKGFDHLIQTTVVDREGRIYRQIYGMDFDPTVLTGAMQELVFGLSPASLNLSDLVNRVRLFCSTYDPSTGTYKFNYAMIFGMGMGALMLLAMCIILIRFLRSNSDPGNA